MTLIRSSISKLVLASVLLVTGIAGAQDRTGSTSIADAQNVLDALSSAYTQIAETAKPFVVNIESISSSSAITRELKKLFPDKDIPNRPIKGTGSGVIIDSQGFIVTNNHVVADANAVHVTLADGRKYRAQVVGVDPMTDVAVIKIDASDLKTAVLGDSDQVRVGQIVFAIGSPFRLGHSLSHGIISGIGRNDDIDVSIDYKNWLQTDAPINPGNSGGPLINTHGEVIGLNVAIATDSGGHQGVGFAIPSNTVRRISSTLKSGAKIVRGYLGVQIQAVDETLAGAYGLKEPSGVFIGGVGESTPAAKGGLRAEDIVLAIDGKSIRSREQLQEIVAETKPGSEVAMNVWRSGAAKTLRVTIEEQPHGFSTTGSLRNGGRPEFDEEDEDGSVRQGPVEEAPPIERSSPSRSDEDDYNVKTQFAPLGFDAETMSPELIKRFKIRNQKDGVLITRVDPGSEAFTCNLRKGMVVVKANDRTIHNASELFNALTPETLRKGVRLRISIAGDELFLVLRIQ